MNQAEQAIRFVQELEAIAKMDDAKKYDRKDDGSIVRISYDYLCEVDLALNKLGYMVIPKKCT